MIPPELESVCLLGWHLYPWRGRNRAACFKGATAAATCDLDQIERWCRDYPGCGWRVVFGPSRIWGIDLDRHDDTDGIAAMHRLVERHGELPCGPRTKSGGGGVCLFFADTGAPIRGETGYLAPGIDARRGAQSVTIPPSIHHRTGQSYRWMRPPWEIAPPTAPAWLLRALAPPTEPTYPEPTQLTPDRAHRRLCRTVERVASAMPGSRNDTLNRAAYGLAILIRDGLLSDRDVSLALYGAARRSGQDHAEAVATIKSGLRAGARG